MPQITDEQMVAFQEFMSRFTPQKRREGPDPAHRGVIDPNYVRPAPTEFPKMMHHSTGMTKIVQSRKEQEELGAQWHTAPVKRIPDWKSKLNEVYSASGFRIYQNHLEFLQANEVPGVATLQDAAKFIDMLDNEQQEQFFKEAEDFQPIEVMVEKGKKK